MLFMLGEIGIKDLLSDGGSRFVETALGSRPRDSIFPPRSKDGQSGATRGFRPTPGVH